MLTHMNRRRSPDTHTCPGLKAATQTIPCDVFCITRQKQNQKVRQTQILMNSFYLPHFVDELRSVFYSKRASISVNFTFVERLGKTIFHQE